MKKFLQAVAIVMALALSSMVVPVAAPEAQAQATYTIRIHNHSSRNITDVRYRWEGTREWGANRLGGYVIAPSDLNWYFNVQSNCSARVEVYVELSNGVYATWLINPCLEGIEEFDMFDTTSRIVQSYNN